MKKKGQVTMFVIMGIVVLFIFLFLLQFQTGLIKQELQMSEEGVLAKLFQKEALRIYVEDCLIDELEEGIFWVGKYGRLWDNLGGTAHFVEGVTGTTYLGEQIYYGIQEEEYLEHQEAYPCDSEENYPVYCGYQFPDTEVKFGKLSYELEEEILEDLKVYLEEKATICVQDFVTNELSSGLTLEFNPEEVELDLSLKRDGLAVEATYPITLTAGEDNFFHLATFDFLYPSGFKRMLQSAVSYPLRWDWQFIDFPYTSLTFKLDKFNYFRKEVSGILEIICDPFGDELWVCSRRLSKEDIDELQISMKSKDIADNGDTIFTFTSPFPNVLNRPENYTYKIARKNRAPALDYISRCPGTDYDYLIMEGDDFPDDFGKIIIKPNSTDPDDDVFDWSERTPITYTSALEGGLEVETGEEVVYDPPFESDEFVITVAAIDEFEARDWQDIRVKVAERELPTIEFLNAIDYSKPVSLEDPVQVNFNLPDISDFTFTLNEQEFILENGVNGLISNEGDVISGCDSLGCDFNSYADISTIKDKLDLFLDFGPNTYLTTGIASYGSGDPECEYSIDQVIPLTVAECTYHLNEEHPYSYPNHELKADGTVEAIDPYLSTHACCEATSTLSDADKECYSGEGCFDNLNPYYLKETVVRCGSGGVTERGNLCNGDSETDDLPEGVLCGVKSLGCPADIPDKCERQKPGSIVDSGWCNGDFGCEDLCETAVVDLIGLGFDEATVQENYGQYKCECESGDQQHTEAGTVVEAKPCFNLELGREGVCEEIVGFGGGATYECS